MNVIEALVQNRGVMQRTSSDVFRDAACARENRIKALLPSGSGFDNGTTIETVENDKVVFHVGFHHMNHAGYYVAWSHHYVTVTPSFVGGLSIRVSGRNVRGIKDHIAETFQQALSQDFDWN